MAREPEKGPHELQPNVETWISAGGAQSLSSTNDGGVCSPSKHQKPVITPTSNLSCSVSRSSNGNNDVSGTAAAAEDLQDAAEKGRSKTKIALIMLALSVNFMLPVMILSIANRAS